jgi:hypothetical protein
MSKAKPKKKAVLTHRQPRSKRLSQRSRGGSGVMDALRSATNIGFLVRALDYGGLVFEDDRPRTLAEGMSQDTG